MCDYSLMIVPNRLAMEGDELAAHRFRSGTTGFVSCLDFAIWRTERQPKGSRRRLKASFASPDDPTPVVCIPPGARLLVQGVSGSLSGRSHLGSSELATFTQLSAEANQRRDALCFDDGPLCGWKCLRKGNGSRCCGSRPPRTVRARPKRYSTATLRDDR